MKSVLGYIFFEEKVGTLIPCLDRTWEMGRKRNWRSSFSFLLKKSDIFMVEPLKEKPILLFPSYPFFILDPSLTFPSMIAIEIESKLICAAHWKYGDISLQLVRIVLGPFDSINLMKTWVPVEGDICIPIV